MQWLSSKILSSEPIQVGQRWLTIRSQTIQLTLPFLPAALVWNRPVTVQVQERDETIQSLPVVDVTRIAQLSLLASGLLLAMIAWRKVK